MMIVCYSKMPITLEKTKQIRNSCSWKMVVVVNKLSNCFFLKVSLKKQGTVLHAVSKSSAIRHTMVPSSGCKTLRNVWQPLSSSWMWSLLSGLQPQTPNTSCAHLNNALQRQRNKCALTLKEYQTKSLWQLRLVEPCLETVQLKTSFLSFNSISCCMDAPSALSRTCLLWSARVCCDVKAFSRNNFM